jgi:hypothetical protein
MQMAVFLDIMVCSLVDLMDTSKEYAASIFIVMEYTSNPKSGMDLYNGRLG